MVTYHVGDYGEVYEAVGEGPSYQECVTRAFDLDEMNRLNHVLLLADLHTISIHGGRDRAVGISSYTLKGHRFFMASIFAVKKVLESLS